MSQITILGKKKEFIDINFLIELMKYANEEARKLFIIGKQDIKNLNIITKEDNTYVTNIDLKINEIILEGMKKLQRNLVEEILIISEESPKLDYEIRKKYKYAWLIDPIDGTNSLIEGIEDFTICIGLVENQRAIFGIVGLPMEKKIVYGGRNVPIHEVNSKGIHFPIKREVNTNHNSFKVCCVDTSYSIKQMQKDKKAYVVRWSNGYGIDIIKGRINELRLSNNCIIKEWDICCWDGILKGQDEIKLVSIENYEIYYNTKSLLLPCIKIVDIMRDKYNSK